MGFVTNNFAHTFSRPLLAMRLVASLVASLPLLIFVKPTPMLSTTEIWPWLKWRLPVHFFLTLGVLHGFAVLWSLHILIWLPVFLIVYGFMALIITKYGIRNIVAQKEKVEQKHLYDYTDELERQYNSIRKFEHDYQNILLSMKGYLDEDDLPGLKQYYISKVEVASEAITKNHFALRDLDKIKVREIKSILAAKLGLAQRAAIEATFEANEVIDHFSLDSVKLVRILGIILDNAIEALIGLEKGKLFVGCFKWESGIYFIVQNTCPPDMPEFHMLWKPDFTTKGKGRGLGLSNLLEIVASLPAATLETDIADGSFIQKLIIAPEEERSKA